MERVTLDELLSATRGKATGFERRDLSFGRVSIDSRTVRPGDLFWAVRGEQQDGHQYIRAAFELGAAACVVHESELADSTHPTIVVPNTRDALLEFASWYRHQRDALVVGLTGSVGKTTTRELVHSILSARFSGTRSQKNYNNHFGLPLSLLEIESSHEFAVLEMGASARGEIHELARAAAPEIGLVTRIGMAHVERFGGPDQIARAKGELLEALPKSGFAVIPGDQPELRLLARRANCPVIFVGEAPENDLQATQIQQGHGILSFRVDGTEYQLAAVGKQHVSLALCAVAIGREIGMTGAEMAAGLATFRPVSGRSYFERIGPWSVVDDSYNASPESMLAACETLRNWKPGGRRILVLGDMLELGSWGTECHRRLGEQAGSGGIDHLIAFGDYSRDVIHGAREAGMDVSRLAECSTMEAVLAILECWLEPEDVILVKGSRGMRMERVIEMLRDAATRLSSRDESRTTPGDGTRACA